MEPLRTVESPIIPLHESNIDTDQLTPARFLRTARGSGGYGEILLHDWRWDDDGEPREDCVLHDPRLADARIVVAGDNFGCGSSRETAAWALAEYGIRAVVSTSFGDIFRTNALKNGILPIQVDEEELAAVFAAAEDRGAAARVDVEAQTLTLADGREIRFDVDPFYKHCLLEGLDQMGYLLSKVPEIESWEAAHPDLVRTTRG